MPKSSSSYSDIVKINENQTVIVERTASASYFIVDASGCLLDNHEENVYKPVCDLKKESFAVGVKKLCFDENIYWSRYEKRKGKDAKK